MWFCQEGQPELKYCNVPVKFSKNAANGKIIRTGYIQFLYKRKTVTTTEPAEMVYLSFRSYRFIYI